MKVLMESWRKHINEAERGGGKVIFMAGAPGAGKSTVIDKLDLGGIEIINPDEFYEPALEKCGLGKNIRKIKEDYFDARHKLKDILKDVLFLQEPEDGWQHEELMQMLQNAFESEEAADDRSYMHQLEIIKDKYEEERARIITQANCFNQAQRDAKTKQAELAEEGKSFIVDGTGGRFAVIRNQKDQLEESGYDTAMIFVEIPLESAISRQDFRGQEGGRTLDTKAIEKSWGAVNKNMEPYQELFDNFFRVSASDEEMEESIVDIKPQVDAFLAQVNEDFQSELKPRLHKQMKRLLRHGGNQDSGPFHKKAPIDYRGSKPPGAPGG